MYPPLFSQANNFSTHLLTYFARQLETGISVFVDLVSRQIAANFVANGTFQLGLLFQAGSAPRFNDVLAKMMKIEILLTRKGGGAAFLGANERPGRLAFIHVLLVLVETEGFKRDEDPRTKFAAEALF